MTHPGPFRLYLSGPMTGYPEFNAPAFDAAAEKLRAVGYEVFNPVEGDRADGILIDGATGDEPYDRRTALAADLNRVCRYADGLALLPDAERSSGAWAEIAAARAIPIPVLRWPLWIRSGINAPQL